MKLTDFRQTIFVTKEGYNKVILKFDELRDGTTAELLGVKKTIDSTAATMLIPAVKHTTYALLTLKFSDGTKVLYTKKLIPVKKMNVSLIDSSHEDFGTDDYSYNTGIRCTRNLDTASKISEFFPDYRYTAESYYWIEEYRKYRSVTELKKIYDLARRGTIEINPIDTNLQTHLLGPGILPCALYGIRELQKHGIFSETVVLSNVSGISSAAVTALCSAGIKYAIIRPVNHRNSEYPDEFPVFFRLMAPNGKDSLLILILPMDEAAKFNGLFPKCFINNGNLSEKSDPKKDYFAGRISVSKYNFEKTESLLDELSTDFEEYGTIPLFCCKPKQQPSTYLKAFCDHMNSKWMQPEFGLSTPTACMKQLESASKKPPVIYGKLTDDISDNFTAYPNQTTEIRKSAEMLSVTQALATLRAIENNRYIYPDKTIKKAEACILRFASYQPLESIKSPLNTALFNFEYNKNYQTISAEKLIDSIDITPPNGITDKFITVINSAPFLRKFSEYDFENCENFRNNNPANSSVQLPEFGEKSIIINENFRKITSGYTTSENMISTDYYSVSYDKNTGKIYSIIYQPYLTEIIDSTTDYSLGDFLYVTDKGINTNGHEVNKSRITSVNIEKNEHSVSLIRNGFEEQSGAAVKSCITFYDNSKSIYIKLQFSEASGLCGDFSDRFRKNIFYAFPLKCDCCTFYSGASDGAFCEETDRLSKNPEDFTPAYGWAAIENEFNGVALMSHTPMIFYRSKSLFLHAASNRLTRLNFRSADNCSCTVSLVLTPYSGSWKDTIPRKFISFTSPFLAYNGFTMERSRISLSAKNVQMTTFKPAEDRNGFIARFIELTGTATKTEVTFPVKISKAFYTDIIENDVMENPHVSEKTVSFSISKNSYTTLRIIPAREYNINSEPENSEEITGFFSYKGLDGKNVVVWDKKDFKNPCTYDIICDGAVIATEKNNNAATQHFVTETTGTHTFSVRVSDKKRCGSNLPQS